MALASFEKPTAPKRIPRNRHNPPEPRLHFVLDAAFVDEVYHEADGDGPDDN